MAALEVSRMTDTMTFCDFSFSYRENTVVWNIACFSKAQGNVEQLFVLCGFLIFFFFSFLGLLKVIFTFRDLDDYGKYFSQKVEHSSLGRLQLGLKKQQCWFHMFLSQHMRPLDQPKTTQSVKKEAIPCIEGL